jgi:hypothetical protein
MGSAHLKSNASQIVTGGREQLIEAEATATKKVTALKMKRKIMKHTVSSTIKGRVLVHEISNDSNMIKRAYSPPRFIPVNPS